MLLPKLKSFVVAVVRSRMFHQPQQPASTAFPIVRFIFQNFMIAFRRMPFQISDHIFQPFFVFCSYDKMDVTWHDAIAKYFQSFMILTVFYGLDKNFAILFPCEKINLIEDGERYKVRMMVCT